MAIGDGILTPAISGRYNNLEVLLNSEIQINWCLVLNITYAFQLSVLSAVSGIRVKVSRLHESESQSFRGSFCSNLTISILLV